MARLIIILITAVMVYYFFGGTTPQPGAPGIGQAGPAAVPPSRLPVPKKTAQVAVKSAVQSTDKPGFRTFSYKLAMPGQPAPQTIAFDIPDETIITGKDETPRLNASQIRDLLVKDKPRIDREISQEKANRLQQVVNIVNAQIMMPNGVTMTIVEDRNGYHRQFNYWKTHQNKQTLAYLKQSADQLIEAYQPYQNLFERQSFVARQTQYISQLLPYNYYSYDLDFDYDQQKYFGYLRPDFMQIARVQRPHLYNLAKEIFKAAPNKEPRDLVATALYFIQAIPVDTQDTKRNLIYRKTPFATPVSMLVNNSGSADTKATALASLLGILLPDYTVVMYLLPEHAAIGINLPPGQNDYVQTDPSGNAFVLMEPFGPGLMPVGQVNEYTSKVLAKGLYSYFIIPQ